MVAETAQPTIFFVHALVAGERPGITSSGHAKILRLKREVADLRRANEILKAASTFSQPSFDRPATK